MVILVLAILAVPLAWLVLQRTQRTHRAAGRRVITWAVACLGAALVLRAGLAVLGPLRAAIVLLALAPVLVWLWRRRRGGDGPDDDGRDDPVEPGPDPSPDHHVTPRPERDVLDPAAFDKARAEWESQVHDRG